MCSRLDKGIRYMLREYQDKDVEDFIHTIWHPLIEDRTVEIELDQLQKPIFTAIPILKKNSTHSIGFVEYLTSDLPQVSMTSTLKACEIINSGERDVKLLGKRLSSSNNEDTWISRGYSLISDLKLFSLIDDNFQLTELGKKYLENRDKYLFKTELLKTPLFYTFYNIIRKLEGFGEVKDIRFLVEEFAKLIVRNSLGDNLIKDSVTKSRMANLIGWFIGVGIFSKDLETEIFEEKVDVLLLKKEVNWSLFEYGVSIPQDNLRNFFDINGEILIKGMSRRGKFIYQGKRYDILIMNADRKGVKSNTVHIRYDSNESLKKELVQKFKSSYEYIMQNRLKKEDRKRKRILIPNIQKEYLYLYSTGQPYHYRIEFDNIDSRREIMKLAEKSIRENKDYMEKILDMSDKEFKNYLDINYKDADAKKIIYEGLVSRRRVRNKLVKELKMRYDNCCQICGFSFKDEYGEDYSEAHHIKYFSEHEDHSPENIIILCPNHHRIIHEANAEFIQDSKAFKFPNGKMEYLKYCTHL